MKSSRESESLSSEMTSKRVGATLRVRSAIALYVLISTFKISHLLNSILRLKAHLAVRANPGKASASRLPFIATFLAFQKLDHSQEFCRLSHSSFDFYVKSK